MPQREIDTKARGVHSHMRRLHSDPLLIRSQPLTFVRSEAAWTLPVRSQMRQIEVHCQMRDLALVVRDELLRSGSAYDSSTVEPLAWASII